MKAFGAVLLLIIQQNSAFCVSRAVFAAKTSSFDPFRQHSNGLSNTLNLRGGAAINPAFDKSTALLATLDTFNSLVTGVTTNPSNFFNVLVAALIGTSLTWKLFDSKSNKSDNNDEKKPAGVKSLQLRFLAVFWLLRMADWLQGPYFYEVFSSKILNGTPVSLDMISKLFLVGFASTGIFGPWMGRFVDVVGRKAGTLLYTLLYAIGALSTRSSALSLLLVGRLAGGLGTSLLFSAPEAWLVGEHVQGGFDGKWLGQTFGWAYAGDSIVAILAGQLASWATGTAGGPTGPFTLSVAFLIAAAALILPFWNENTATPTQNKTNDQAVQKVSIKDAIDVMAKDRRIMLLGAVQALFEGAMYIFVLQWAPALKAALLQPTSTFAAANSVPYGNIFSCFMASCLLGSTAFGSLQKKGVNVEQSTAAMLLLATTAMGTATAFGLSNIWTLVASFVLFEACVGCYFPSIGTLRSKYLPDAHRSVIMNLFGIPLNLIVVSVFLSIKRLGSVGALSCATAALALAAVSMLTLVSSNNESKQGVERRAGPGI